MYIWNYVLQFFLVNYWGDDYRTVPVFLSELDRDRLAEFVHTPQGFNAIILSSNQGLTDRELMGVLLHEICHHVVFEECGCEVEAHGDEWKAEMRHVGFRNPDELTDGCDFFSEEEYLEILGLLPKEGECE